MQRQMPSENYKALSLTTRPCDWTPMIEQCIAPICFQYTFALTLMIELYNTNYALRIIQSHVTEQYKMPKISKTTASICLSLSLIVYSNYSTKEIDTKLDLEKHITGLCGESLIANFITAWEL